MDLIAPDQPAEVPAEGEEENKVDNPGQFVSLSREVGTKKTQNFYYSKTQQLNV